MVYGENIKDLVDKDSTNIKALSFKGNYNVYTRLKISNTSFLWVPRSSLLCRYVNAWAKQTNENKLGSHPNHSHFLTIDIWAAMFQTNQYEIEYGDVSEWVFSQVTPFNSLFCQI